MKQIAPIKKEVSQEMLIKDLISDIQRYVNIDWSSGNRQEIIEVIKSKFTITRIK